MVERRPSIPSEAAADAADPRANAALGRLRQNGLRGDCATVDGYGAVIFTAPLFVA
jgi:hypothetical protein